jgi:hypothetical protein
MNTPNSNNRQQGGNNVHDDNYYKYKAAKYHYKIQEELKKRKLNGQPIPNEYEYYLKAFN